VLVLTHTLLICTPPTMIPSIVVIGKLFMLGVTSVISIALFVNLIMGSLALYNISKLL
jgi:hypothetical protein